MNAPAPKAGAGAGSKFVPAAPGASVAIAQPFYSSGRPTTFSPGVSGIEFTLLILLIYIVPPL
jgi:hypothetical protein